MGPVKSGLAQSLVIADALSRRPGAQGYAEDAPSCMQGSDPYLRARRLRIVMLEGAERSAGTVEGV